MVKINEIPNIDWYRYIPWTDISHFQSKYTIYFNVEGIKNMLCDRPCILPTIRYRGFRVLHDFRNSSHFLNALKNEVRIKSVMATD